MSLHLKLCLCLVVILYGLHDQKMFFHKYAVHFHGRRGDVAEAVEWIHGGADDVGQPGIAAVIRIVLMEIDIIFNEHTRVFHAHRVAHVIGKGAEHGNLILGGLFHEGQENSRIKKGTDFIYFLNVPASDDRYIDALAGDKGGKARVAQVHKGGAYGGAAHVEGIAEGAFHQKGTGLVFAGYDAVLNPDISLVLLLRACTACVLSSMVKPPLT